MEVKVKLELTPEFKNAIDKLIDALTNQSTAIPAVEGKLKEAPKTKEKLKKEASKVDTTTLRTDIKKQVQALVKADKRSEVQELLKKYEATSVSTLKDEVLTQALEELKSLG